MADPLDILRLPDEDAVPDQAFAARLRSRIERALAAPRGVAVITTASAGQAGLLPGAGAQDAPGTAAPDAPEATAQALTPYLAVAGARQAIDWYAAVLGAHADGEPVVMPDGRIGHAELVIGGARLYLSDEHPEIGVTAPAAGAGACVTLHLEVPDADAACHAAATAGATVERAPADQPYGRIGVIRDPFGHRWMLSGPAPAAPGAEPERDSEPGQGGAGVVEPSRDGDAGFFSLWVPDVDRAAAFYSAALGWRYERDTTGLRLAGSAVPFRITSLAAAQAESWPGQRGSTVFCSRGVTDLDAAVARVRAAGGQARERSGHEGGRVVDCADDQGMPFALHEQPAGTPRPAMTGGRPGDIAYLTMRVTDAGLARAFYGAVFGWSFSPGSVPEGWQVSGPAPMTGLHGGQPEASQVPMYLVDDVAAAVAAVRAAGGTASEPERQPYGLTADGTDDQGLPFHLGELSAR